MPTKKQNRDYLHNEVIPHVREMAQQQELRMLAKLGTCYTDPSDLTDVVHKDDGERPAVLNFALYETIYAKNCNIINDEYNCGRTGCLAGWYKMMSEQQRRFVPWDPDWLSIGSFDTRKLARHFNISQAEAHDLFGSTGEGVERESLYGMEGEEDEDGCEMSIEQVATAELTQGEILEMRAGYLEEIMGVKHE
jgi:hypothetical protein